MRFSFPEVRAPNIRGSWSSRSFEGLREKQLGCPLNLATESGLVSFLLLLSDIVDHKKFSSLQRKMVRAVSRLPVSRSSVTVREISS